MLDLQCLPDELLILTCCRLDQSGLHSISLTCKRLYALSFKVLYNTPLCQQLGDNGSHMSLLQAIAAKPELAKAVRHLRFNYFTTHSGRDLPGALKHKTTQLAKPFGDLSVDVAEEWRVYPWNKISDYIGKYSDGLTAGLLLYYATHLESLYLGLNFYKYVTAASIDSELQPYNLPCDVLRSMLELLPTLVRLDGTRPLDRLRNVILMDPAGAADCRHNNEVPEWTSDFMSCFFRIPTIKTLVVHGLMEMGDTWDKFPWTAPARSSNITTLVLMKAHIMPDTVQKMLRSCTALEIFHWSTDCDSYRLRDWDRRDKADFLSELVNFATTLTRLDLIVDCHNSDDSTYSCLGYWHGLWNVLPALSNLEYLRMDQAGFALSQVALSCHQSLPPTLKQISYTLDAVNTVHHAVKVIETVIDACRLISDASFKIVVDSTVLDARKFAKLKAQWPQLFFALHKLPDPEAPTPRPRNWPKLGLLRISTNENLRPKISTPFHNVVNSATAPFHEETSRPRPYKCKIDDGGECECKPWAEGAWRSPRL